jgi:bifunctional UDP-N-acetylglucosamine pyrophosphorylase/glucosamine-1-phosphate N-acetyltransferase
MQSQTSKVLHSLGGLSVIEHVTKTLEFLNMEQIIYVIPPEFALPKSLSSYDFVIQETSQGTAHAVMCVLKHLKSSIQRVLILCGDTPLIQPESLTKLLSLPSSLALLEILLEKPEHQTIPYGRIICNAEERPVKIVEYSHATEHERTRYGGNSGCYAIDRQVLDHLLPLIEKNPVSGEYYLTDIVQLATQQGFSTEVIQGNFDEFYGVNTRQDLAYAEHVLQERWREKALNSGVTLVAPQTVFFSHDTIVSEDVRIEPYVRFGTGVRLENQVTIRSFSYIEKSNIGAGSEIGPFAHLRGGNTLKEESSIGNFVEIKGSTIGSKTKVKHLSYIGDTDIGASTNVGAGTITCNYDGYRKYRSTIGDGVLVGAHVTFIAPVHVQSCSIVGAGTVVDQDLPEGDLGIGRACMQIKPGWAKKFHIQHQKKP